MVLTKEQIEGLKRDINFGMAQVLNVGVVEKQHITVRDLFDTILAYQKWATQ